MIVIKKGSEANSNPELLENCVDSLHTDLSRAMPHGQVEAHQARLSFAIPETSL